MWWCSECGSSDVYATVLVKEKEFNFGGHNKKDEVERLLAGDRVVSLEDKILSSSPKGKSGQVKLLLVSPTSVNQF